MDIEISNKGEISGKGQRAVKLFGGMLLPMVPKIIQGKVSDNRGSPVLIAYLNFIGCLNGILIIDGVGAEFNAILHLVDSTLVGKGESPVGEDHNWSRKGMYKRFNPAIVETFRLSTGDSDNWHKVPDDAITTYLDLRKNDRGLDSKNALRLSELLC